MLLAVLNCDFRVTGLGRDISLKSARWRCQSSANRDGKLSSINGKIGVHPHLSVYGIRLGSLGLYGDLILVCYREDAETDIMVIQNKVLHTSSCANTSREVDDVETTLRDLVARGFVQVGD